MAVVNAFEAICTPLTYIRRFVRSYVATTWLHVFTATGASTNSEVPAAEVVPLIQKRTVLTPLFCSKP